MMGIDIGNGFTKVTCGKKHIRFPSRITIGAISLNSKAYNVNIHDKEYSVGTEYGEMVMNNDKYMTKFHDVLLFTAIASNYIQTDDIIIQEKIVTGLPIEYYKSLKDNYKNKILSYDDIEITINNSRKIIKIEDVDVFPQSAIVFTNEDYYKNTNTLVLDWGAGTLDVSLWEGLNLIKYNSYPLGCYSLYQRLANAFNNKNVTKLRPVDIEKHINDTVIMIYGEKKDFKIIKQDIIASYVNEALTDINNNYPVETIEEIVLTGGGANILDTYVKEHYNNLKVLDNQFINSDVYYNIGGDIFA